MDLEGGDPAASRARRQVCGEDDQAVALPDGERLDRERLAGLRLEHLRARELAEVGEHVVDGEHGARPGAEPVGEPRALVGLHHASPARRLEVRHGGCTGLGQVLGAHERPDCGQEGGLPPVDLAGELPGAGLGLRAGGDGVEPLVERHRRHGQGKRPA